MIERSADLTLEPAVCEKLKRIASIDQTLSANILVADQTIIMLREQQALSRAGVRAYLRSVRIEETAIEENRLRVKGDGSVWYVDVPDDGPTKTNGNSEPQP